MDLFATWSYFTIRTVRVAMSNKITRPIIKYSKNGCRDSRKLHRSRETIKDEVDAYDYVTYFQRGLLSHEFLCLACIDRVCERIAGEDEAHWCDLRGMEVILMLASGSLSYTT
jgi:hypothetical protein